MGLTPVEILFQIYICASTLLTLLPESIPCESRPKAAVYPPTPSLPLRHAPAKPGKQQHIQEPVCRENERVGEERDRMGKLELEGRGGGILWEGSQSNYRQRCSPGFFGGTKFTPSS